MVAGREFPGRPASGTWLDNPAPMAAVTFQSVDKKYGDVFVIEDLNLDVYDQEFLVLVGPSGCGKTTALRMIAGLEDVSGGTIAIGGHVVNDVPPKARDIAMVFQNYALYPHMTVRENLEFGLKMRKIPAARIDALVSEAADLLGLASLLDRKPAQLSGGQRQRVALGRAIVRHPAVFLFDEPLSNLDAKLRVQMRAEIKKLQQRLKTTTVYVTHDQVTFPPPRERVTDGSDARETGGEAPPKKIGGGAMGQAVRVRVSRLAKVVARCGPTRRVALIRES
jgi:ABC-type sugar transport system ATPase subunit